MGPITRIVARGVRLGQRAREWAHPVRRLQALRRGRLNTACNNARNWAGIPDRDFTAQFKQRKEESVRERESRTGDDATNKSNHQDQHAARRMIARSSVANSMPRCRLWT